MDSLSKSLDAPELNNHILRENTQIPTKEEVHSKFVGAKVFSKIDASAAFWRLKLDKENSDLCTFNTPYGRYKYLVMPYGIKSASEIFHRELRNLFEGVEGVENTHDDIVIDTKTVKEHMEKVKQAKEDVLSNYFPFHSCIGKALGGVVYKTSKCCVICCIDTVSM